MSNSTTLTGSSKQYIGIVDMICEGPIYGLVNGKNSVYLDNIPFENSSQVGSFTREDYTAAPTVSDYNVANKEYSVSGITLSDDDVGKYLVASVNKRSGLTITAQTLPYTAGLKSLNITDGTAFTTEWNTYPDNLKFVVLQNNSGVRYEAQSGGPITGNTSTISVIGQSFRRFNTSDSSWTVELYQAVKIQSVTSSSTFVAETTFDFSMSNDECYIRDNVVVSSTNPHGETNVGKVDGSTLQFRVGSQEQAPIQQVHGVSGGVTRTGSGSGVELQQYYPDAASYATGTGLSIDTSGYPEGQSFAENGGTQREFSSSAFGAGSVASQVDEINIRINYNSLITYNNEGGDKEDAHAIYVFEIKTETEFSGGPSSDSDDYNVSGWKRLFSDQGGYVVHKGRTTAPVSFDHTIGLQRFKPFKDFTIRITRLTRSAGLPVRSNGGTGGETDRKKWTLQASASTGGANLSATIKDKFTYPHTSLAAISFSSKSYSNLPKRSYLIQGLKVKIPSTYTPRELTSDGIAKYDGFWDGTFKDQLYYTDNPAWVFYDIVTNNRYGAGRWLEGSQINKYALYRVAKYCDELVDDGNGGTEPRFRANIYLAKATDVYKVLKDMATVFTGILYWMDGSLTAVQDVPTDPIYTFTKGNVINGTFNYEGSGAKTGGIK